MTEKSIVTDSADDNPIVSLQIAFPYYDLIGPSACQNEFDMWDVHNLTVVVR